MVFTKVNCMAHLPVFILEAAGTISVWLFVSHFHILLASDGKGLLVLVPKLVNLNIFIVMLVYVLTAVIVHNSVGRLKEVKSFNYFVYDDV